MRIISPVDNLQETPLLLDAGADELYGGYLPPDWLDRYGVLASPNQRTFAAAQIGSEADLAAILELVHARGRQFALTLNAPFYTEAQQSLLLDYVDRMVELGIDSLILADPGLIRRLSTRHPQLPLHASTLAHLTNAGSLAFYARLGIRRAVLPRHLTVAELHAIVACVPQVKCDAFLLVGKCPNTEGLCTFQHASPDRIWPCETPYRIEPVAPDPSAALQQAMARQASWATTNRRHGCGLCAIPWLRKAAIDGLKLVGRGAPGVEKARNIKMVREFIALAAECADFAEYRRQAMDAHRRRFAAACHVNVCYYPEFLSGEMS
ncbi:MAG: peptidase U32 family protein [Desulfuromonadales bacterium]|nr:peptidase U32 family protein [Desulfuromonadales bacterium]